MPTDIIYSDDGRYLDYHSKADPSISHRVLRDNVVSAAFIAQAWHGGQWTGLYALGCGSFDYDTIERAHAEACTCAARFDGDLDDPTEGDAYTGLLSMIDDLATALDPRFGLGARCVEIGCETDAEERAAYCAAHGG